MKISTAMDDEGITIVRAASPNEAGGFFLEDIIQQERFNVAIIYIAEHGG